MGYAKLQAHLRARYNAYARLDRSTTSMSDGLGDLSVKAFGLEQAGDKALADRAGLLDV
jgi:hypothetical protein